MLLLLIGFALYNPSAFTKEIHFIADDSARITSEQKDLLLGKKDTGKVRKQVKVSDSPFDEKAYEYDLR